MSFTPIWSADGGRIFFASNRINNTWSIFSKAADGSGVADRLTSGHPTSISSVGLSLIFRQESESTGSDIWAVRLGDDSEPEPILQTPFDEHSGTVSPDNRWLAYVSNESGQDEVYVRPFPGPGGKYKVSTVSGAEPAWAPDGKEIFYRNGDQMMAVPVTTEPDFALGKSVMIFEGRYRWDLSNRGRLYDVSPDGRRFLMIKENEEQYLSTQINIVLNWDEELKRLVPTRE